MSRLATIGPVRRNRTFVGCVCAACEEPLEHILRGERILQLACGHVSHEECLYEYVRDLHSGDCPTCQAPLAFDTARGGGGNIDYGRLNKLVRSAQGIEVDASSADSGSRPPTIASWNSDGTPEVNSATMLSRSSSTRQELASINEKAPATIVAVETNTGSSRTGSVKSATSPQSSTSAGVPRPFNDAGLIPELPGDSVRRPVSIGFINTDPLITLRSEFPTVHRAPHKQSLTCMVSVEVGESRWPLPPDANSRRQTPSVPASLTTIRDESTCRDESTSAIDADTSESTGPVDSVHDSAEALEAVKETLLQRVDNWHGLDTERFGSLLLHGSVKVGKDRKVWQDLECYLFSEMLICIKEKRPIVEAAQSWDGSADAPPPPKPRCVLKGSIFIKKHLEAVEKVPDHDILSLSLAVADLPTFHLLFSEPSQLEIWNRAFHRLYDADAASAGAVEHDSRADKEEIARQRAITMQNFSRPASALSAAYRGAVTTVESPASTTPPALQRSLHVPLDLVVVIPISSAVHGLKVNILRDSLRFLLTMLGDRDRMGIISFGSGRGPTPIAPLTTKHNASWHQRFEAIQPVVQNSIRPDVLDATAAALDMLARRRACNPLAQVLLISDAAQADQDADNAQREAVIARATAVRVPLHTFGLGMTHRPDDLLALSMRTNATYTYVKDWMVLRECLAGCVGSLQSISHPRAVLRLRLPEGATSAFAKITGAGGIEGQVLPAAGQRHIDLPLGDLRFGDKRDILVQLAIMPDAAAAVDQGRKNSLPTDHWDSMIASLQGDGPSEQIFDEGALSEVELPVLEADLVWEDVLREGGIPVLEQLPQSSLLAITQLPAVAQGRQPRSASEVGASTPPHPLVVQRRLELLTADMLSRAVGLVEKDQAARATHLLTETRTILNTLGKNGVPAPPPSPPPTYALPLPPTAKAAKRSTVCSAPASFSTFSLTHSSSSASLSSGRATPSQPHHAAPTVRSPKSHQVGDEDAIPRSMVDTTVLLVLDYELTTPLDALAYSSTPDVFARDARKAVLQTIGVLQTQRGVTGRGPAEALFAGRVPGVARAVERSRAWRDGGRGSRVL